MFSKDLYWSNLFWWTKNTQIKSRNDAAGVFFRKIYQKFKNVNRIIKGKRNNFLKNVKLSLWELLLQEFLSFLLQRPTIVFIIIWDFLILQQIFYSSQVKRSEIISSNHGIHVLPHKLLNKLRLLLCTSKRLLKIEIKTFP